jgi:hypothetical protein
MFDKETSFRCLPPECCLWLDKGFQGVQHVHENIMMPKKKSKNGKLTESEKVENTVISALRMPIEKFLQVPRVIEAISEGVTFTTLEHSIAADSVVILRPRLSLAEKEIAIQHAFHFSGRPYDFNFDFLTDSALVCTELIYKVYEPSTFYTGIKFPLRSLMGRQLMTANDIAEMFDKNYGSASQQLDFISFYDGHEWQQQATLTDIDGFRANWKRPKWYKWVQGTAMAAYP